MRIGRINAINPSVLGTGKCTHPQIATSSDKEFHKSRSLFDMFSSAFLISVVLLALSVAANPVVKIRESSITLPISRRLNITGTNIADADRARAAHLKENGKKLRPGSQRSRRQSSFDVTNAAVTYTAEGALEPQVTLDTIPHTILLDSRSRKSCDDIFSSY